ncbi:MAG: hypothetical protein PVI40_00150 [Chlamydiota bacterium]
MKKAILACLIYTALHSDIYIFKPCQVSLIGGYRQDELNLSYRQEQIQDPNAIRESIDTMHVYQVGGQLEVMKAFRGFFRSKCLYGYGHSSHAYSQMRVTPLTSQGTIAALFMQLFPYTAEAHIIDTDAMVGYPIRGGPLTFIPFLGYSYDRHNIKRENIGPANFTQGNTTATFFPTNNFKTQVYAPLVGIEIRLTPSGGSRVTFIGEYEFHWGIFTSTSSYKLEFTNDDVLSLSEFIKQNVQVKKRALSHLFFLKALIGLNTYSTLGLKLKYQYTRAHGGESNQRLLGYQTINGSFSNIDQSIQRRFNGFVWQYLGGEIELSVQF